MLLKHYNKSSRLNSTRYALHKTAIVSWPWILRRHYTLPTGNITASCRHAVVVGGARRGLGE